MWSLAVISTLLTVVALVAAKATTPSSTEYKLPSLALKTAIVAGKSLSLSDNGLKRESITISILFPLRIPLGRKSVIVILSVRVDYDVNVHFKAASALS